MPAVSRLVQIRNGSDRRVAVVDEPHLRLLDQTSSVYALAAEALASDRRLQSLVDERLSDQRLGYDDVYAGTSPWRLMAPIDHPEPARCLVSGTGLTHLGSAAHRQAMHGKDHADLTDSMRMFRAGLDGGRPPAGTVGAAPEWFYKGTGAVLCAPGEALELPPHAHDGGEEAELAGIYVIDPAGRPRRLGMAAANEFSDHALEKTNYLHLASSKLRTCAVGPELVVDPDFSLVPGEVSIERGGTAIWSATVATGDGAMCHSLANLEHHHFKHAWHRHPGDVHVHFYGADRLSFGDGVTLQDGDVMVVRFAGFGRPLRNPVRVAPRSADPVVVTPL
ncbi:MAG: AraD1 family protein [Vicinamibacterales bacterium]